MAMAPIRNGVLLLASLFSLGACLGSGARIGDNDVSSALGHQAVGIGVLSLAWRHEIASSARDSSPQQFASPVVRAGGSSSDDRLYVGSSNGWFYAMKAIDGEVIWKSKVGSVSSKALVHRGRIYVGTDDGVMICLDRYGEEQWRYATRAAILQQPLAVGDALIVANEGDQVYSLDLESGKFRWLYKADSDEEFTLRGHSGVALDGDLLYAGFSDGSIVALRSASGSVAWVSSLRGGHDAFVDVDTTPIVVGQKLVAASSAGGLFALDKDTGRILWNRAITGGGGLVASGKAIFFAAAEKGIYALDLDGNIRWRQGIRGGGETVSPSLRGDYIFYTLAADGLFVARADTGEVVQYLDTGYGISSAAELGPSALYVLNNAGFLYALALN